MRDARRHGTPRRNVIERTSHRERNFGEEAGREYRKRSHSRMESQSNHPRSSYDHNSQRWVDTGRRLTPSSLSKSYERPPTAITAENISPTANKEPHLHPPATVDQCT
ncbi:hypothetical protein Bca52824_024950 [Brassica carinata]|uniref:Uncharacterized protein n=1 Tax=Brassica carinata TaxID=52824 RepID=A0A8X7VLN4_BRACI|nr:hypothetical protein Bca52824_024950 [Brassica carinata]